MLVILAQIEFAFHFILDVGYNVRVRRVSNLILLVVAPALLRRSRLNKFGHLPKNLLFAPQFFVQKNIEMGLQIGHELEFLFVSP